MKIEIKNVSKRIKGVTVLDKVNYVFNGGTIYGLNGKNGCGKTMLMRMIAGIIHPTEGKICINDKVLGRDIAFPKSMGILIETPAFLNEYTGYENLKILANVQKKITKKEIYETLEAVGLDPKDKRKVYKYSLGMRQRLGIAAAVMGKPEIILLDEPINALDADGVKTIRELIRSLADENRIIIIACHDKEEMDFLADKKIYMSEGMITGDDEA